jgi:hypothetical protein
MVDNAHSGTSRTKPTRARGIVVGDAIPIVAMSASVHSPTAMLRATV